jgi:hypothetical protein
MMEVEVSSHPILRASDNFNGPLPEFWLVFENPYLHPNLSSHLSRHLRASRKFKENLLLRASVNSHRSKLEFWLALNETDVTFCDKSCTKKKSNNRNNSRTTALIFQVVGRHYGWFSIIQNVLKKQVWLNTWY